MEHWQGTTPVGHKDAIMAPPSDLMRSSMVKTWRGSHITEYLRALNLLGMLQHFIGSQVFYLLGPCFAIYWIYFDHVSMQLEGLALPSRSAQKLAPVSFKATSRANQARFKDTDLRVHSDHSRLENLHPIPWRAARVSCALQPMVTKP